MESRRRRMRLTYKQLKLLVKFMVDNPLVAKGVDYRTAVGRHYHDSKWSELAELMNSQDDGMTKSPREWNKYWKDLKAGIRKKVQAKKAGNKRPVLSGIQQMIYHQMCIDKHGKFSENGNETHSYLQIPKMDDHESYERVEYLEDYSGDETDLNGTPHTTSATEFIEDSDTCLKDLESVLNASNEAGLDDEYLSEDFIDKWLTNKVILTGSVSQSLPSCKSGMFINLEDNEFSKSVNTEPNLNSRTESEIVNKNSPNKTNNGANAQLNSDVLVEIRNQLKELVALQKDRAKSAQRIATVHERRVLLEERKVKLEEKRLRMEEQRLKLEEKKMEIIRRRVIAEERIAAAAERSNDLKEAEVDTVT